MRPKETLECIALITGMKDETLETLAGVPGARETYMNYYREAQKKNGLASTGRNSSAYVIAYYLNIKDANEKTLRHYGRIK